MKGGASTMPTINLIKPRLSSSVNISIEALVKAVGLRPNCVEVITTRSLTKMSIMRLEMATL